MTDTGKFKVGDRVRTSGWGTPLPSPEVPDGMAGTVVRVTEHLPYPFEVNLDVQSWTDGPLLCHPHEIEPLDG